MATRSKLDRPVILRESDQILSELSKELASLKDRMSQLEEEQEENRHLVEKLSLAQSINETQEKKHVQEVQGHKENYRVIAEVMHNLKSPVSEVVHNLKGIISEIDDEETQESLRECMDTASFVLSSFEEVEDFCKEEGEDLPNLQEKVSLRDFFKDLATDLQRGISPQSRLRLLVDRKVPEEAPLPIQNLKEGLEQMLAELVHQGADNQFTLSVLVRNNAEKYGVDLLDLVVEVQAAQPVKLAAAETWIEFVQANQPQLRAKGFKLMSTRDRLRRAGGNLELQFDQGQLAGLELSLPLTY